MRTLQPGQHLGPYELEAELGQGGMATVFRARQPSLNRYVALKVLAPELARDPDFVSRFQREATIAARLEHPNIVPIYDIGQAEGAFYIAMRFVPGRSLAQVIQQVGPMSLERARRILAQIASALDHAHQQGVIHRDLKPGNILWEEGDRVSLADFGIARAGDVTQVTRQGMLVGTPKYMAPEQALGQEVDHRADLYALGVIAYEMLAGKVPFEADSVATLLHRHAYEPPPPLREARPDLSPEIEAVIQRMLAKQPDDRYPNAATFVAALAPRPGSAGSEAADAPTVADLTRAAPAPTTAPTPSPRDDGWRSRLPVPLYSLGVAAAVLAIAGATLAFGPLLAGSGSSPGATAIAEVAATPTAGTSSTSKPAATRTASEVAQKTGTSGSPTAPATRTVAPGATTVASPTQVTPGGSRNPGGAISPPPVVGGGGTPPQAPTPTSVAVAGVPAPTMTPTVAVHSTEATPPSPTPPPPTWPSPTPPTWPTPTFTTTVNVETMSTPTAAPTETPTAIPMYTPTVAWMPTVEPTATTGITCRPLDNVRLTAMTNRDLSVTVAWSSTGGCGPFSGKIAGYYGDKEQPFQTYSIGTQTGNLSSRPPTRCGGTHPLRYTLELFDNQGQQASATATTTISFPC